MFKKLLIFICILVIPMGVEAQERSSLEQARMAYICALADTAVYDTELNEAVRGQIERLGWHFTEHRNADKRADTKFYTLVNQNAEPGCRETLVVIPGTEKMKDVEVDLRFSKVHFAGSTVEEFKTYAAEDKVDANVPMVHRGFNDYTMTAFFTPDKSGRMGVDYLRDMVSESDEHLYITGHSLGGAVGTLLAARLISLGAEPDRISVFTFGAPTVGNTAFAEEQGYRIDLSRYTMSGDAVNNALQALKAGYVHIGTEYKWKKNENSHKYNHAITGYLDAAIRGYYDEVLGGNLTLQQLAAQKPEAITEGDFAPLWNRQYDQGRVYIAPIHLDLPDNIANDSQYMQVAAGDLLLDRFQRVRVAEGNTADSSVDGLFAACQEAEQYGCQYIAQVNITGTLDKSNPKICRLVAEAGFYNTSGEQIRSTMTSITTKEVTPIEAVIYNMARIGEDIQAAQQEGVLPR